MTVEKPKPKQLLRPITAGANSATNQSQFIAITCNSLKAREKYDVYMVPLVLVWFSLVENLARVFKANDRNHIITFDSHLKTLLKTKNSHSGCVYTNVVSHRYGFKTSKPHRNRCGLQVFTRNRFRAVYVMPKSSQTKEIWVGLKKRKNTWFCSCQHREM